jgi:hypothetical protein
MSATIERRPTSTANHQAADSFLQQRCPSPLVLTNNVPAEFRGRPVQSARVLSPARANGDSSGVQEQLTENPFSYWQRTLANSTSDLLGPGDGSTPSSGPKRTVSLGPKRPKQIGEGLQKNPFVRAAGGELSSVSSSPGGGGVAAAVERRSSFGRAARELQSSLTELDKLIDSAHQNGRPTTVTNSSSTGDQQQQRQHKWRPPLAGPPVPSRPASVQPRCRDEDELEENARQRFMWQEDLANWKSSSSVNDLLSMFESAKSATASSSGAPPPPPTGSGRPRLGSTSVLRRTPWQNMDSATTTTTTTTTTTSPQTGPPHQSDYAIRRTTSTSSSLKTRPALRNPYRTQYS